MQERKGLIRFGAEDQTVLGPDIKVGQVAPGFVAVGQDWSRVRPVAETAGKVRVFAAVPSLDTRVCDRETRRFNEEAASLGEAVHIFVISMDLPFAQKRWCSHAQVDRVVTLSDHVLADFGTKYGCLMREIRLLRRAVFVVGRDDRVVYADYMPELGDEPLYEKVLEAVRGAL